MKKRIRRPVPHASLYASAIVLRHMRELAATRGVKVNDVMLAGLDVIFKQNGLPGIGDIEGSTNTDNLCRLIHGIPARKGQGGRGVNAEEREGIRRLGQKQKAHLLETGEPFKIEVV